MMKLKELPKVERPREKLIAKGPQNLKDEELLAILLRTGREGKNVLDLAKQILRALNYLTNSLISNIIETRLFILSKNRNYEQKRNNLARNFISSH